MRPIILFLIIIPFIVSAGDPVTVQPEQPFFGTTLTIAYDPEVENSPLKNAAAVSLYALYWTRGDELIFHEFPMQKEGSVWKTSVSLTDKHNVQYITFKFVSDGVDDNNDGKFWDVRFYTLGGEIHPATYYHHALSYLRTPGPEAGYSGAEMYREVNRETGEKIIRDAYKIYPRDADIARMYIQFAARDFEKSDNPDEAKAELLTVADMLEDMYPHNPSVLASIANMYEYLGDDEMRNEYRQWVISAYPLHRESEIYRFRDLSDREIEPVRRLEIAKSYLRDFSESPRISQAVTGVVSAYAALKRYEEAFVWLESTPQAAASHYRALAELADREGGDPELVARAAQKALDLFGTEPEMPRPSYITPREWAKRTETERYREMNEWHQTQSMTLLASAYSKMGNHDEAIKTIKRAYEFTKGEWASVNTQYVTILRGAKKNDDVLKIGRASVVANKTSDILHENMREAYIEVHGTDDNFISFVKEAEEESYRYLRGKFAGAMLDETAPLFTLTSLGGDPVSLADLKGKVVVLDFWATWCGPCIAAFPYLQKVVDHFSGNDEVIFLAVNTWDGKLEEDRINRVAHFMQENGYSFTVLFDEDTYVREYGVRGVPTRIAVGRDGVIKFRDVGFSGPGMVTDMIVQIELLLDEEGPLSRW
jgi:thiol-disulfide isomerase/thioredoxin